MMIMVRVLLLLLTCLVGCVTVEPIIPKFDVAAICDHMPVWKESPERRYLSIKANRPDIAITVVEVIGPTGIVYSTCLILGNDSPEFTATGMFPEGLHGQVLTIKITYFIGDNQFSDRVKCTVEHSS